MRKFEDLVIWKESRLIVKEIYGLMSRTKDYGLKDQIQRASISVMNNISEGSESEDGSAKRVSVASEGVACLIRFGFIGSLFLKKRL